jgi:twitching motility two-component system response regulator PilH
MMSVRSETMAIQRVLVCDDSATDLANIKSILEGVGCTVITALNGVEALQKAKAEKPDLIFLDILMPAMDGYEACRFLASDPTTKDIPVVFVTTKNQKADRLWAQMQGGKDFISKPFAAEQIIAHVKGG